MKINLQRHKQLIDRADRLKKSGGDFIVTILDFFHSPFGDGTPQQRLACHMADAELNGRDIEVFILAEQVLTVITDPQKRPILKDVVQSVQNLAAIQRWQAHLDPTSKKPFLLHYSAETDGEALSSKVREIGERESIKLYAEEKEISKRKQAETLAARQQSSGNSDEGTVPLTGAKSALALSPALQLEFIESQLEKMDILDLARLQPIAKLKGTWLEAITGQEIYVSLNNLAQRLGVQIELTQHYLLLRHLTRHLDRHMLNSLTRQNILAKGGKTHVNLALDSIRTKAFVNFDASLGAMNRHNFVFEISATEALANTDAFMSAIDLLSHRGYGVALDGLTAEAVMMLDLEDLPLSAIKVIWRSDLTQNEDVPRHLSRLAAKLPLVLCRCDGNHALVWGASVGIDLFQGTAVDGVCAQSIFSSCEAKAKLGCAQDRCRARHWRIQNDPGFACPRKMWIPS
jgi:EAL domain-containing protein (putative c-di-GMP-specific phosphodiesterase class I)